MAAQEIIAYSTAGVMLIAAGLLMIVIIRQMTQSRHQQDGPSASLTDVAEDLTVLTNRLGMLLGQLDDRLAGQAPSQSNPAAGKPVMPTLSKPNGQPIDANRKQVLELAAQGLDPIEIARRTGMNVGEINLIVNLQRQAARTVNA